MTNAGQETFSHALVLAEADLWSAFERANEFAQQGDVGAVRETALRTFLASQLPTRYTVASGEVIDSDGRQTGQTDLLIYDGWSTRPLLEHDGLVLMAAEALLATVEVKSTFRVQDARQCAEAALRIHSLRPWGEPWIPPRQEGRNAADRRPRVLISAFAYRTDITTQSWASSELRRLRSCAAECGCPIEHIDRVTILDRGLLLPAAGRAAMPGERGVLRIWFFSLVNFLARETDRRKPFPWDRYEAREATDWRAVAPAQYDLPREPAKPKPKPKRRPAAKRRDRRRNG